MKHAHKVNKTFKYTPSVATDISKTIARARKEQEERDKRKATVTPIASVK